MDIFEQMDMNINNFYKAEDDFHHHLMNNQEDIIDEDDFGLKWVDFHAIHPNFPKEEYDAGVKAYQEM